MSEANSGATITLLTREERPVVGRLDVRYNVTTPSKICFQYTLRYKDISLRLIGDISISLEIRMRSGVNLLSRNSFGGFIMRLVSNASISNFPMQ